MKQSTAIITSIILFFTSLFAGPVFANIGPPPSPSAGNLTGDSYFSHLKVLREELSINMSEIDKGKPVEVYAKYLIECPQLLKHVDLVFVANGLTESRYRVDLDGNFLNGYLSEFDTIPPTWLPPDSIKHLDRKIPYFYRHKGLISFRFDSLSAGQHTLIVNYDADASEWFDENDISITRTFVYILKPGAKWQSFKNFHLTIFHPDNWEFSSNLELERATGYSLSGDWPTLPDNYITIAIRKPSTQAIMKSTVFLVIAWISYVLVMIFWMSKVIQYRIRNNKRRIIQILNSVLVSFLAAAFFYFIYYKNQELLEKWLDNQVNPLSTYGTGYFIMGFPIIWFIAFIITMAVDYFLTIRLDRQ